MPRDVGKFDRKRLHVQGDGRPFSLGEITPMATLRMAAVEPLTSPLKLDEEQKQYLTSAIREIMASYLGEIILSQNVANRARAIELLPIIEQLSVRLAGYLSELDNEVLRAIEAHRSEPHDTQEPPPFDILSLDRKLRRLSHATGRARAAIKANPQGPQKKTLLDRTVSDLIRVIEAAGLPITPLNSSSATPRRQVRGTGGELLTAIFRKFDPHIDEPQIWGAINRVRTDRA